MKLYISLIITTLLCCAACVQRQASEGLEADMGNITWVGFDTGGGMSKALSPDEALIKDVNLLIYNEFGLIEHKSYIGDWNEGQRIAAGLLKNCKYRAFACANFGYEMDWISIQELMEYRHFVAYPDDFRGGMAMCGTAEFVSGSETEVDIKLERLFSKITLLMDRSELDSGVDIKVRLAKVGGCPKCVTPFAQNRITDVDDMFVSGYLRDDGETEILNTKNLQGRSGEVTLYLMENLQGEMLPGNTSEQTKFFPEDDPRADYCSYVELFLEYMSPQAYSVPGNYLKYRFYLGDGPSNFDVRRNTEYRVVIVPSGNGLGEDSWRIDHEGLGEYISSIELNFTSFSMNYIGQNLQLEAYVKPDFASKDAIYWYSSDESVAKVSENGLVTAVGEGNCKIVCCATDGGDAFGECSVTVEISPYYMRIRPGNYIRCELGDTVTVSCEYFPPNAPFDIGVEELEYDKSRGIYDYVIAPDGKSVTLYTKSLGSGLLYLEAGEPINHAELIVLVVD